MNIFARIINYIQHRIKRYKLDRRWYDIYVYENNDKKRVVHKRFCPAKMLILQPNYIGTMETRDIVLKLNDKLAFVGDNIVTHKTDSFTNEAIFEVYDRWISEYQELILLE